MIKKIKFYIGDKVKVRCMTKEEYDYHKSVAITYEEYLEHYKGYWYKDKVGIVEPFFTSDRKEFYSSNYIRVKFKIDNKVYLETVDGFELEKIDLKYKLDRLEELIS